MATGLVSGYKQYLRTDTGGDVSCYSRREAAWLLIGAERLRIHTPDAARPPRRTAPLAAFRERLLLHLFHEVSRASVDNEVAGAGLLDLAATVIQHHQPFRHDLGDAEAGLVRVWETRNATVREHLKELRLSRIDRYRPQPVFVGRHPCVLRVSLDRIAGQPGKHQNVLIR